MIKVENVDYIYRNKKNSYKAVDNVSFIIEDGKFIILFGQSGSGKTTVLNMIGGLLKPTAGQVLFDDVEIYNLSNKDLCNFRRDNVGFIFQNYFLENCYTSAENVIVPLLLNKFKSISELKVRAASILKSVGLEGKENNRPTELSGGECQRVAIARALVNNPKYIIADEPTGNLDSINGLKIINLLKKQVSLGKTVIMVTHNELYKEYADVIISIKDGKIL